MFVSSLFIGCEYVSGRGDQLIPATTSDLTSTVLNGADVLVQSDFEVVRGKKIGLIVNHTSRVGETHLIDIISSSTSVELVALFGPEHGIRGDEDAGAKIEDGIDDATGVPVYSLYGANRRPTPDMLKGVDALVFDIQDVGARFYTFISTLGLSMQSAAEADISFYVLDRPNPLGGKEIEGFVLDTTYTSFVGQYPIPIRHGLTVGELAKMIQGEKWLPGLESLDLHVIAMKEWTRDMLWPETGLAWIPPSPNLPTFETALMYPGTCFFEATSASEGRGTDLPFLTVGAPWMDAVAVSHSGILGLRLIPGQTTPTERPGKSSSPKWKDVQINSVSIEITEPKNVQPVSAGLELISRMYSSSTDSVQKGLFNEKWILLLGGNADLSELIKQGTSAKQFRTSWATELAEFEKLRSPYLLYK